MMLMGVVRAVEPRARSFMPSAATPWMAREDLSSRRVMGWEGFRRPWVIQDWIVSRLMGESSAEKLEMC